ncbi:uncharacterized protein TNCV_767861 [Trichonephila clavipes]|nr:uncharacterized protein TNCV_767861 [Trichonephila clavipes]
MTATAGSDVVQSGRPIFDDFFQHLWPYIGNNMANVVFQMVKPTRGLLATDHVIFNHGQVTWTTPELAPLSPNCHTTQREDVSALDRFNEHRCPTRRVFSGTGLELVTRQATARYLYHSATAATIGTLILKTDTKVRKNQVSPIWYREGFYKGCRAANLLVRLGWPSGQGLLKKRLTLNPVLQSFQEEVQDSRINLFKELERKEREPKTLHHHIQPVLHKNRRNHYKGYCVMSFDPVKIVVASELKQFEFNGIEITGFTCKIIKKENRGETVSISMNFSIMMNCPTDRETDGRELCLKVPS